MLLSALKMELRPRTIVLLILIQVSSSALAQLAKPFQLPLRHRYMSTIIFGLFIPWLIRS